MVDLGKSLRGYGGVLAILAAVAMHPVPARAQDQIKIRNAPHQGVFIVRPPGQLDTAIIDAVAEVGAEQTADLPALSNVWELIANKCGKPSIAVVIHPRYREKLLAANSPVTADELSVLTTARTLTVPACARFAFVQAEFDAPNGIKALVQQLEIPFDLERFRLLASGQNPKAAIEAAFKLLQANPNPGSEACSATDLSAFFACVNAIEVAFLNRERIRSADRISGKIKIAIANSGKTEVPIPISEKKAASIDSLVNRVNLTSSNGARAFKAANQIANIIPGRAVAGESQKAIEGVAQISIVGNAPPRAPADRTAVALPVVAEANQPVTVAPISNPIVTGDVRNDITFVTAMGSAVNFDPACSNAHEVNKGRWPFDVNSFMRVLALNYAVPDSGLDDKSAWTRALVVDTGFDFTFDPGRDPLIPEKYYFPRHQFAPNERQVAGSNIDTDGDGIPNNRNFAGVNLASKTRFSDTSVVDGDRRSHGLSVTTLVLGGRADRLKHVRAIGALPVKVGTASLVTPGTNERVIDKDYITNVVTYAKANGVKVINLSLSTQDTLTGFQAMLESDVGKVFVVAAGNNTQGGRAIHEVNDAVYPAVLGGRKRAREDQTVVISVGAHNGNGDIARFSNFSNQAVNVLAPGCMVPSYDLKRVAGGTAWVNPPRVVEAHVTGTSFAAPLVSFVVSILMSDQQVSSPGAAKERVILGTDFDLRLKDRVFSSGRLNAAKVLGYRYDVLELPLPPEDPPQTPPSAHERKLPFGEIRYGALKNVDSIAKLKCNFNEIEFKHVRKLAYDKANKAVLLISNPNPTDPSTLTREICAETVLDGLTYKFFDEETGVITDIAATDVLDYVAPRLPVAARDQ